LYIGQGGKDENNLKISTGNIPSLPIESICGLIGNAIGESGLDPSAMEKITSYSSPHGGGNYDTLETGKAANNRAGLKAHKITAQGGVGLFQWTETRRWRFETDNKLWEKGYAVHNPTTVGNCGSDTLGTRLWNNAAGGYSSYFDGGPFKKWYCGQNANSGVPIYTKVGGGIHGWWMGTGHYGWWSASSNRKGYIALLRGASQNDWDKSGWRQKLELPKSGTKEENYFNHIIMEFMDNGGFLRDTWAARKIKSSVSKKGCIINAWTMTYARMQQMWYFIAEEPKYRSDGTKGGIFSTFFSKITSGFVGANIQAQIDEAARYIMYENLKPGSALCDPDNYNGYKQLAQRNTTKYPTPADVTARVIAKCGSDDDSKNRLAALESLDKRQAMAQQTYNTWLKHSGDTLPTGVPWMTPVIGETRHSFDKGYPLTFGNRP
jgi:hypothetical protein